MKPNDSRRDQRQHARRNAGFAVTIGTPGGPTVPGDMSLNATDLSESGAFLRSELLFEEGEILTLSIPLPSGKTIETTGRVVRTNRETNGQAGMGLLFLNLTEDARRILTANLQHLMGTPKP